MKQISPYQPKGSMCMSCKFKDHNCSALPFHDMPVIKRVMEEDVYNVVIVKCTYHQPMQPKE